MEEKKPVFAEFPSSLTPSPIKASLPSSLTQTSPIGSKIAISQTISPSQKDVKNDRRPLAERMRPSSFHEIMVCNIPFVLINGVMLDLMSRVIRIFWVTIR